MTNDEFDAILEKRLAEMELVLASPEFRGTLRRRMEEMRRTLATKAKEYALNSDRLENFARGAALLSGTLSQCCFAYLAKHLVSIATMVENGGEFPQSLWDDKIGDAVNYFVLLEACIVEQRRTGITFARE